MPVRLRSGGVIDLELTAKLRSCSAAKNIRFIPFQSGQPTVSHRHALALAIGIPYSAKRQGFGFFLQSQPSGVIATRFTFPDSRRFEQTYQERAQYVACADNPGRHPVNARIEIVQPNMNPLTVVVGYDFPRNG